MSILHGIKSDPPEGSRRSTKHIILLDGNNYSAWQSKTKVQLIHHNVWELVNGKEIKPPNAPAEITNVDGAVANRAAIAAANVILRSYYKGFKQAASIISESISDSQIYKV